MDTRTGQIHDVSEVLKKIPQADPNRGLRDMMAQALGGRPSDYVPVQGEPDPDCTKCDGTGAVKVGLRSKRFKPCECTER